MSLLELLLFCIELSFFSLLLTLCGSDSSTSDIFETLIEIVGDGIFVIRDLMTNHYSFPQVAAKDSFTIQLKVSA